MTARKLTSLIIGAGQIGAFYDSPESKEILTHAHGYSVHEEYELLGIIDNDILKAQQAAQRWGCSYFQSIDTCFEKIQHVDVVSVTCSTPSHFDILSKIMIFSPNVVFVEKPFCSSSDEAQMIIEKYKEKNISLLVNYSRSFVPEFKEIVKEIRNNEWGNLISGCAKYGKGLLNNGSHILFFINECFETFKFHQASTVEVFDSETNLKTLSFTAEVQGKPFYFMAIPNQHYTIFEIEFLLEKGRIVINNSGFIITKEKISKNPLFPSYRYLGNPHAQKTHLDHAIMFALDNIANHILRNEKLQNEPYQSFKIHQQIEACLKQ